MHRSLIIALFSVFTVAYSSPLGGSGYGGVVNDKAAQRDAAQHYGEGFIEQLGEALQGFRQPQEQGKRQLPARYQGEQFLPADAQSDFKLPQEIHERAPGPNVFADPNGHERFQNVHNNEQRQEVYFSTHIPGGSYYTHKAHHHPIVNRGRQKRQLPDRYQGEQFLPADAQSDFRLPQEIHERALGPNLFADPNGHERFQNVHNNEQRQEVYFSTHIPGGSYYTHKAHHSPIVRGRRY